MAHELEDRWAQLQDATPAGWFVGRPHFYDERNAWKLYAFDTTVRPQVGKRSREWTAVASTEVGVVAEMARCLREIREGRWPQ